MLRYTLKLGCLYVKSINTNSNSIDISFTLDKFNGISFDINNAELYRKIIEICLNVELIMEAL